MSELTPRPGAWQRFRALPDESPVKTLVVTLAVCLLCSTLVATSVVLLRPYQLAHREQERESRFLALAAEVPGLEGLMGGLGDVEVATRMIDLETGRIAEDVDPEGFDPLEAARDPERSWALGPEEDLAGIGRRPRLAPAYLVREGGALRLIVLPVYGAGYASTLRGYLALDPDGNTVRGLSFYEQGETPGLGAQIEDPDWLALWSGKRLRDETGTLRIRVAKGEGSLSGEEATFAVEGISGATLTGVGVTNLIRFWTGSLGFGPFLERIREEEAR